jgi:hypothetical protein
MIAAGFIWVLTAIVYQRLGQPHVAHEAIMRNILEYAELMLFLLCAMTYINSMEERNVFQALRAWFVNKGFSLRVVFWITGFSGLCHLADRRQPDHRALDGRSSHGRGRRQHKIRSPGLYQHRDRGQCRRRLLALWRHHHPDGLAEGPGAVRRPVSASRARPAVYTPLAPI